MKITHKIVTEHASYANLALKNYEVRVNRRNGYYALDVYIKGAGLMETLYVGTAREVYDYLSGMISGAKYKDMMMPF